MGDWWEELLDHKNSPSNVNFNTRQEGLDINFFKKFVKLCLLCRTTLHQDDFELLWDPKKKEETKIGTLFVMFTRDFMELELKKTPKYCCLGCTRKVKDLFAQLLELRITVYVEKNCEKEQLPTHDILEQTFRCHTCHEDVNTLSNYSTHFEQHSIDSKSLGGMDFSLLDIQKDYSHKQINTIPFVWPCSDRELFTSYNKLNFKLGTLEEWFAGNDFQIKALQNTVVIEGEDCDSDASDERENKDYVQTVLDVEKELQFDSELDDEMQDMSQCRKVDGMLECNKCKQRFCYPFLLRNHLYSHNLLKDKIRFTDRGPYRMRCHKCNEPLGKMKRGAWVKTHYGCRENEKLDSYMCERCGMVYPVEQSSNHKNKHHWEVIKDDIINKECKACSVIIKTRQEYRKHTKSCLRTVCHVCGLSVKSSGITKHMRVHRAPKFTCDICKSKFRTYWNLRNHMFLHGIGTGRQRRCQICKKSFKSKEYKEHMEEFHGKKKYNMKRLKCDMCPRSHVNLTFFQLHKAIEHNEHFSSFRCVFCNSDYECVDDIKEHLVEEHDLNVADINLTNTKLYSRCVCDVCGHTETTETKLRVHLREVHGLTFKNLKTNAIKCPKCEKVFSSSQTLRTHVERLHFESRVVHKCKMCQQTFKFKEELTKHRAEMHKAPKIFECGTCSKKFEVCSGMLLHLGHHVLLGEATLDNAVGYNTSISSLVRKRIIGFKNSFVHKKHVQDGIADFYGVVVQMIDQPFEMEKYKDYVEVKTPKGGELVMEEQHLGNLVGEFEELTEIEILEDEDFGGVETLDGAQATANEHWAIIDGGVYQQYEAGGSEGRKLSLDFF